MDTDQLLSLEIVFVLKISKVETYLFIKKTPILSEKMKSH